MPQQNFEPTDSRDVMLQHERAIIVIQSAVRAHLARKEFRRRKIERLQEIDLQNAAAAAQVAAAEAAALEAETTAEENGTAFADVAASAATSAATTNSFNHVPRNDDIADNNVQTDLMQNQHMTQLDLIAVSKKPRPIDQRHASLVGKVGQKFRCARRCVIRAGFSLKSKKVGELARGAVVTALAVKILSTGQVRMQCEKGWVSVHRLADGRELLIEVPPPPKLSLLYGNLTAFEKQSHARAVRTSTSQKALQLSTGSAVTERQKSFGGRGTEHRLTRRLQRRSRKPKSSATMKKGYIHQGLEPVPMRVQKTPFGGYDGTAFIWHPDPLCQRSHTSAVTSDRERPRVQSLSSETVPLRPSSTSIDNAETRRLLHETVSARPVRPRSAAGHLRPPQLQSASGIAVRVAAPPWASGTNDSSLQSSSATVSGRPMQRPGSAAPQFSKRHSNLDSSRPHSAAILRRSPVSGARAYSADPLRLPGNPRGQPPTARRKPLEELNMPLRETLALRPSDQLATEKRKCVVETDARQVADLQEALDQTVAVAIERFGENVLLVRDPDSSFTKPAFGTPLVQPPLRFANAASSRGDDRIAKHVSQETMVLLEGLATEVMMTFRLPFSDKKNGAQEDSEPMSEPEPEQEPDSESEPKQEVNHDLDAVGLEELRRLTALGRRAGEYKPKIELDTSLVVKDHAVDPDAVVSAQLLLELRDEWQRKFLAARGLAHPEAQAIFQLRYDC
eukprot:SAG31_NODE_152_length_22216_cov_16.550029_8_plen_734_part_00